MKTFIFKNQVSGIIQPVEAKDITEAFSILQKHHSGEWIEGHDDKPGYWYNIIK